MSTLDNIQIEVAGIRRRIDGPEELDTEELETLLVRLEVLRLQFDGIHKEGEAALTMAKALREELESESQIRGLSE